MALTMLEAGKRSRDPLIRGLLLGVATADQMLAKLRFAPQKGMSYSFTRENSLSAPAFVAPDHVSITEGTAGFDQVSVPMRLAIGDADTYIFIEEQMSDMGSQKATQAMLKAKGMGRLIGDKAINGVATTGATIVPTMAGVSAPVLGPNQDLRFGPGSLRFTLTGAFLAYRGPGDTTYGDNVAVGTGTYLLRSFSPNKTLTVTTVSGSLPGANTESLVNIAQQVEPDGLVKLLDPGQVRASVGGNGDALSFDILDQMIDEMVKTSDDLAFVGNAKIKRKFMGLLRSAGGLLAADLNVPGINGPVPSYRGIPFLQNDNIGSSEAKGSLTNGSSLFLIDFGPQGFEAGCGSASPQEIDLGQQNVRVMGLRMREIGELESKEATRTRVSWYGAYALKSKLSAARASELITN